MTPKPINDPKLQHARQYILAFIFGMGTFIVTGNVFRIFPVWGLRSVFWLIPYITIGAIDAIGMAILINLLRRKHGLLISVPSAITACVLAGASTALVSLSVNQLIAYTGVVLQKAIGFDLGIIAMYGLVYPGALWLGLRLSRHDASQQN